MHPEALAAVARIAAEQGVDPESFAYDPEAVHIGLDVGGADVNGSARGCLHPSIQWFGLDIEPGPGVDIVANAASWQPDQDYDVVLCTELFEHTPRWRGVLVTIHAALAPGGLAIITCASAPRIRHGARGAPAPAHGEWYRNVSYADMTRALRLCGFAGCHVEYNPAPGDLYVWARK